MVKKLSLILALIIFLGCSKQAENHLEMNAALIDIVPESQAPPPPAKEEISNKNSGKDQKIENISKKIIKNGDMEIQVADISQSRIKVEENLKNLNAYIQNETFLNNETSENLNLKIRVPNKNFDLLVNSFSNGVGSVLSKNISSDYVTEEYTDVSIKLANKKIYLEKYRDLLKAASTTKDMLEIQEKIRGLEDEIDVSEGRLRFIDDKVNFSTLDLNLYKEKARDSVTSRIGFGSRFVDSISQGWNSFVSFILGIISFWPFLILTPFLVFFCKKWRRRK